MASQNFVSDGRVDVGSHLAIGAEGVTYFRFPRFAYVAEKTGHVAIMGAQELAILHPLAFALGKIDVEPFFLEPAARTERFVGKTCFALATAVAVASQM